MHLSSKKNLLQGIDCDISGVADAVDVDDLDHGAEGRSLLPLQ
jgi:hypothetical protein